MLLNLVDRILTSIGVSVGGREIICPENKDSDVKVGSGICVDKDGKGNPGGLTDDPSGPIIVDPPDIPVMNEPGTFNEFTQVVIAGETNLISPERLAQSPPTMVDEENTDLFLEELLTLADGNPDESARIDAVQKIRNNQTDQIPKGNNAMSIRTNPTAPPGAEEFFRQVTIKDMLSKSHDKFFSNLISSPSSEGNYELAIIFFYPSSDFEAIVDQMEILLQLGVKRFGISLTGLFEDPQNPTMNTPAFYQNIEETLFDMAVDRNSTFLSRILRPSVRYDSNLQQSFNVLGSQPDYLITFRTRTLERVVLDREEDLLDSLKDLRLVVTSVTSSSANAGLIFGSLPASPSTAYATSRLINDDYRLSGLQVVSRSPLSDIPIEDILSGAVDFADLDLTRRQITLTGPGVSQLVPGDVLYEFGFDYQPARRVIMICQFRSDISFDVSSPNITTVFGRIRYELEQGAGVLSNPQTTSMRFTTVLRKLDPTTLLDVNETPPFDTVSGNFVYEIEFSFSGLVTGSSIALPVQLYSDFKQLGTIDFSLSPSSSTIIGSGAVKQIFRS